MKKTKKGITLIALVITIIILIILAAIAISLVSGENGLFGKAKTTNYNNALSELYDRSYTEISYLIIPDRVNKRNDFKFEDLYKSKGFTTYYEIRDGYIWDKNRNIELIKKEEFENKIRERVKEKKIEDKVIFLGQRNDVNKLYQAMDVFVLPSLYEGLPLVGVEAQIAGCRCILSDSITKEVQIRDDVKFISLKNIDLWEKEILNITNDISERKMKDKNKYDIKLNAEELLNIYRIQLTKEK